MKIELSLVIIFLLAVIPAFFVFLAMHLKIRHLNDELTAVHDESLQHNTTILELEAEIVNMRTQKNAKEISINTHTESETKGIYY
jgi:ribosomal protein L29